METEDKVHDALEQMRDVLSRSSEELPRLIARADTMLKQHDEGKAWKTILDSDRESDSGMMSLFGRFYKDLGEASGALREAMVVELREEGETIPRIASLFGVSHQRISNVIKKVSQKAAAKLSPQAA